MSPTPAQSLLAVLKQKKQFAQKELTVRYPSSREWFAKKKISLSDIRAHSARLLTGATLGSALLLAAPHLSLFNKNQTQSVATADSWENFLTRLREVITTDRMSPLNTTPMEILFVPRKITTTEELGGAVFWAGARCARPILRHDLPLNLEFCRPDLKRWEAWSRGPFPTQHSRAIRASTTP